MEEKTIDARGLACPQPVMLTKQALKSAQRVTCIVDNATARDNVSRMAAKEGCQVTVEEKDGNFYVSMAKGQPGETCQVMAATADVMLIAGETLGRGDDDLGGVLVRTFMHTLAESDQLPDKLIFLNGGVKLVVESSAVLDDLRALADKGVEILACGTCLTYFNIKDKVAIGQISNMYSILEALQAADKVISL